MRNISSIVVHCSATYPHQDIGVNEIKEMHLKRGFNDVGYHYVIKKDGTIQEGRNVQKMGAHVRGHNRNSIGVCYVGGLNADGIAEDTRTAQQDASLLKLLSSLIVTFQSIKSIVGHRDLSPDKDGDGKVESHEWLKQCPCFNAMDEYKFLIDNS